MGAVPGTAFLWGNSVYKGAVAGGSAPSSSSSHRFCLQVWLCHHAEVTQQDDGCQAVGAALDQDLPVRGALAAGGPQLPRTRGSAVNRFLMGRQPASSLVTAFTRLGPSSGVLKNIFER